MTRHAEFKLEAACLVLDMCCVFSRDGTERVKKEVSDQMAAYFLFSWQIT